jgi:hypothetical protein
VNTLHQLTQQITVNKCFIVDLLPPHQSMQWTWLFVDRHVIPFWPIGKQKNWTLTLTIYNNNYYIMYLFSYGRWRATLWKYCHFKSLLFPYSIVT